MFVLSALPLALTVLLLLLFDRGIAHHAICNWKEGPRSPFYYGYHRLCLADAARSLSGKASWYCGSDWPETWGVRVADFGLLRAGKIEISTICGGDGWGKKLYHDFPCDDWKSWAFCFGPADETVPEDKVQCFYMDRYDDCEWPNLFEIKATPDHVDVWYKSDDWLKQGNASLIRK